MNPTGVQSFVSQKIAGPRAEAEAAPRVRSARRRWEQRVEEFVLGHIAGGSARVLEVGCGDGALACALDRAGHIVTAIDPQAPHGHLFRTAKLDDFSDPGPFDYVVSSLTLHHIQDLTAAADKIASILAPQGALILVEFAWDRFDDATARWALDRLPENFRTEDPSWLQRLLREWRGMEEEGGPGSFELHCARWADVKGLHSSGQMLSELRPRFHERFQEWTPYLYPELAERASEKVECEAIEAGVINATGFRYVGSLQPATGESGLRRTRE